MPLLDEQITQKLTDEFARRLVNPVKLVVFSQALAEPESEQARRLVEELAALHPKLGYEGLNYVLDKERADALKVARIPSIAVLGEGDKDYGIRMYGMPAGYEFGLLVDTVLDVSSGDSGLGTETREALAALTTPVHLQVFSTPT